MASCTPHKGNFLLINKASEPISRALVNVCGQTIELNEILPTKSAVGFYEVRSDSQYDITIEFRSKKIIRKEVGYVTNGLDFSHQIVVTDTDIEMLDKGNLSQKPK